MARARLESMTSDWARILDDERYPVEGVHDWRIARNVENALYYIRMHGMPYFMSLDHDLGYGRLSGMDFVKTLVSYCQLVSYCHDEGIRPASFTYYVHSTNPVGAENMLSYLDNWRRVRDCP
jgi:hypothetical protein